MQNDGVSLLKSIADRFSDIAHDAIQDEAVIDLMTLVSLSDHMSEVEERDRIRVFIDSRSWGPAQNPHNYALSALTRAQVALADTDRLGDFLDSVAARLHDDTHRLFAVEAIEQVAAADGEDDLAERILVVDIRRRLGF